MFYIVHLLKTIADYPKCCPLPKCKQNTVSCIHMLRFYVATCCIRFTYISICFPCASRREKLSYIVSPRPSPSREPFIWNVQFVKWWPPCHTTNGYQNEQTLIKQRNCPDNSPANTDHL